MNVYISKLKMTALLFASLIGLGHSDTPLTDVHPGFSAKTVRPNSFQEPIVGMDWLSDGRLVVSTLVEDGFEMDHRGEVWILSGVLGDNTGEYSAEKYADGFVDPLGLKVVDDTVYVCHKYNIVKLIDSDGDGFAETKEKITTDFPSSGNFHQFTFGLLYRDGYFYVALGTMYPANVEPFERGSLVQVNATTGEQKLWAGGIRNGNGMAFGPQGEIFVSDNQGHWKPTNDIYHVQEGKFYGFNHPREQPGYLQGEPITPPIVRMPHNDAARSPTQPLYVTEGLFAGQLLIGDHVYGGIQRVFMEKVDGEYQGSLFRFTGGLDCGPNRLIYGPDDNIYLGCVGGGTGTAWAWRGIHFGLQRLTPNDEKAFEMLAVRSRAGGMEIEFTEEVRSSTLTTGNISVSSWNYEPTEDYGGDKINEKTLPISDIEIDPTGKKAFLSVSGLEAGKTIYIELSDAVTSSSGKKLWDKETWYNLNAISNSEKFTTGTYHAQKEGKSPVRFTISEGRNPVLQIESKGRFELSVRDITGKKYYHKSGNQGCDCEIEGLSSGVYIAVINTGGKNTNFKFFLN